MKPVRSDDQIELACSSALEGDVNPFPGLFYAIQAVAEDGFDAAFDFGEYGGCELSSREADKSTVRHAGKCVRWKSS